MVPLERGCWMVVDGPGLGEPVGLVAVGGVGGFCQLVSASGQDLLAHDVGMPCLLRELT